MKRPAQDLQNAVQEASEALLAAIADPSERQRQDIRRVSELKIITDEYRQLVLSGGDCSAADLAKLEQLYSEARAALGIVEAKHHVVDKLEVVFVPPTDADVRMERLENENAGMRKAIAELRAALAKATGEPEPERTLSIPDSAIRPPQRRLPSPSSADAESAAGWAAVLGHQPRPPTACWTERNGYYDPENR